MEEVNTISRKDSLKKLISFKDKQLIKVITGVRRCGKSTLMNEFRNYLLESGVSPQQIIYINFEDYSNRALLELDDFHDYVTSRLIPNKKVYLFFDEIQQVNGFQRVVDSFYINPHTDIYITGSNSTLLSGELATLLSGRYVEIKLQPFSLKEFREITNNNDNSNLSEIYRKYIETSSFPYVANLLDYPDSIYEYLEGIYNTILVKDIINRNQIRDVALLKKITDFVFDNIGLELSPKKIADTLTSNGQKISSITVENYLSALENSYIVYKVPRYNIKGKEHLKTLEKYYVCDAGLRQSILGKRSMDVGHILENVVFLELIRRGYKVYVGKIDSAEVDFVALNGDGITYIQVSASVRDSKTLERELRPLLNIKDSYPKLLLTLDDDPDGDYEGITRTNAIEWLLK